MRLSFFVLLLTLTHSITADDRPGNSRQRPIDINGFQAAQTWRGTTVVGHGSAGVRSSAVNGNRSGQSAPPNLLSSDMNRAAQLPSGMSHVKTQKQQDEQTRQLEQQKEQERLRQEAYRKQQQQRQARQFWGGLFGYRRSSWNQSQSGYSVAGQNRVNQQFGGLSRSRISRSGQSYPNPGFHNQNRFNQSGFVTNLHNVRVATPRGWR